MNGQTGPPLHDLLRKLDSGNGDEIVAKVIRFLDECCTTPINELNDYGVNGETALHILLSKLRSGNEDAVMTLVGKFMAYGANPNIQDRFDRTSLFFVLHRLDRAVNVVFAIVKTFLENGLDGLNIHDDNKRTPLNYLMTKLNSRNGDSILELTTLFLKESADWSIEHICGQTPLHTPLRHLDHPLTINPDVVVTFVKTLLENGVGGDLNVQHTTKRHTALHYLLSKLNSNDGDAVLELTTLFLMQGADCSIGDYIGRAPLHKVLCYLDEDSIDSDTVVSIVKILLEHGCDDSLNIQDEKMMTAFHHMMSKLGLNNAGPVLELTVLFLQHGANWSSLQDIDGLTAMHTIVRRLRFISSDAIIEIVTTLLSHGADNLNIQDNKMRIVLHILLGRMNSNNEDVVLELTNIFLEQGADLYAQDKEGRTPLHIVLSRLGSQSMNQPDVVVDIVLRLLQDGVVINCQDASNQTPLHYLMAMLNPETAPGDASLQLAIQFLEHGADWSSLEDTTGRTALQLVLNCQYGINLDAIVAIVTKFLEDSSEMTLHVLLDRGLHASNNQDVMAKVLTNFLQLSTNPNGQDDSGQTIVHILAKKKSTTSEERLHKSATLVTLIEHGVDPVGIEDNDGCLPLHYLGDPDAFDPTTTFLLLQSMSI